MATRFNDRRTAAAETSADYPVSVGTGSGTFSRPANLNSAEQNTPVNNRPTLTGWGPSVTFAENLVNATPQLLDADVVFNDLDGNFSGGRLTLSGLLAEDRASVRNEGTGAGQIGLSGANVTFGGVLIGTLAGGSGAPLSISFNAAATSVAIDALIQNLTYANVSDTPTGSRSLVLAVIDAAGASIAATAPIFTERAGAANPLNGADVGDISSPTFADLDGDGDLDAVVGEFDGTLNYFQNIGTATAPIFTQRTGAPNPFNGVDVGGYSAPTFADLDRDGDLDAVVGEQDGVLNYFQNTGTATAPIFTERSGAANPFNGMDFGESSDPTFADLDGDGDLDAVFGALDGTLRYFQNTGTATAPIFTQRTGAANPFNGVDVGSSSAPTLADLDGDGDLDAVVGEQDGVLNYFQNTGTATAPIFTERSGAANPFNGVDVGSYSTPTFADLDGDGDLDALVGELGGNLFYVQNIGGAPVTVNVSAQNDSPTVTGLPTDVTVVEDVTSNLNLSAVTLTDRDVTDTITVVLTASAGTMSAASSGSVSVTNPGTGILTLTGTAAAIDAFLNTASAVQYIGALNANGDNAATLTVTANDGSGVVTLGVVNIDITPLNDVSTVIDLTFLTPSQGFVVQWVNRSSACSSVGDVNGDGIDDLIVGTGGGYDGGYNAGEAYVIYGQAGTSRGLLDLSTLSPSQGFVIQGDRAGDVAGSSVSSAGDVNGDGIDDLIVGAPAGDDGGQDAGEAYVIYGQVGTSRGRVDLSTLSPSQGFIIQGDTPGDYAGHSVSSAGDVNGDGLDDLIVGALQGDDGGIDAGEAYVIYGQAGTSRGRVDLSTLSPSQGFVIQGDTADDWAGFSVSSAGDVNGDGLDDLIVGAIRNGDGGPRAGAAYVIYGQAGTSRGLLDLSTLSPSQGFVIQGAAEGDQASRVVSSAGDVNGDGIDDLIVGAPTNDDGGIDAGAAYVIYGQPGTSRGRLDLSTLSPSQGFIIQGDSAGDLAGSVSSAGDVNGDGIDDLIVGAGLGDDGGIDAGEAYVIYGQAGTSRGRVDLSTLSPSQGFIIRGDVAGDWFGFRVSDAGDVNGDGLDDLMSQAVQSVETYVIYGFGPGWLKGTSGADTLNGTSGADFISGLRGDDVIYGLDGDDVIDGGYGDDRIFAGLGDDTVVGGVGNNTIDGGAGWDIVTVSGPASAYRVLKDGDNFILKGPDGGDSLTNVEAIRFGDGKVLDLARMYGPDVDTRAWADGRIPEALLSGEGPRPLIWVQETTEKDVMPEVLPAADDAGLDRFGEPGPLIGVFGGGSDPSIPLTLNEDSDDFLTTVGGTNGGDVLLGNPGDRVDVAIVARPQFGGDRVVPGLMNGRERELRVEADGRISEAGLLDEKASGDRPLVLPGADDAELLTGKGGDRPEVLPGADDGDQWMLKDDGEPLVLPGAAPDEVLIAKHGDEPEVLPAVDDVTTSAKAFDGPEVLPAAPVDKFLVEAEVLPPLPGDHFSAEVPEVLPALDDGFLVMGKYDDLPPVMPTLPDDIDAWDVAAVIRPSSETLALILEGAEHPYGHSLTLLDELPAVPSKGDAWE